MAHTVNLEIPAHYNIYTGSNDRNLQIEFCYPENGTNDETGIALFAAGFGGHINSNVYKKMRTIFADKYNLITVQCKYFGAEHMQNNNNVYFDNDYLRSIGLTPELVLEDVSNCFSILNNLDIELRCFAKSSETPESFCDMGYMQAIDLITSVEAVKIVLERNEMPFDRSRLIGYGHSHGAFLIHLSNVLCSSMYSFIIDNSAWIKPRYYYGNRLMFATFNKLRITTVYKFIAKEIVPFKKDFNLEELYGHYHGNAQSIIFQGVTDDLIDHNKKREIFSKVSNADFHMIDDLSKYEGIFSSTDHGLGADFLKLFDYSLEFEKKTEKLDVPVNEPLKIRNTTISREIINGFSFFTFSLN